MLISVVIATFNAAKTIQRALDSIYAQSITDFECIVVDGLSKDDTVSILENNKERGLKYVSEKDNGIFDALNKGVRMASGEWVYVLGADDELLPNAFLNFHNTEYLDSFDLVYGETIDRFEDGHIRHPKSKDYKTIVYQMFACHQSMFMRRDMMLKLGLFSMNYRLEADFDLTLRAYLAGYKFKKIDAEIAYFSMAGATGGKKIVFDEEHYRILKNNKSIHCPMLVVYCSWIKNIIKRKLLKL